MFKLGAHKRVKPKGFRFNPRFYDPKKEELEKRRKAYEEKENSIDAIRERMSKSMRSGGGYIQNRRKYYGKYNRQSNLTLVAVLVVLLTAFYWFFLKHST